jgi:hypothetical protein
MSIRIGVYDFFSYTIPGAFYLFFGFQLLSIWGETDAQKSIQIIISGSYALSITYLGILFILSYVIGLLMESVSRRIWEPLFVRKDWRNETINYFKKEYPELNLKFNVERTNIMFIMARNKYEGTISLMDWYRAIGIHLRNISFALFLLFVTQIIALIKLGFQPIYVVSAILLCLFSFIAIKYSSEFNNNQFSLVCRSIIAEELVVSDFVERKRKKRNDKNEK